MTTTLVTGATGTVGSRVVRELRRRGAGVRAFVRDPNRAHALLGPDVELAVGDLADPASLRAALDDVDRMFLACANVPHQVGLETTAIDVAAAAGVRRIVKLSAAAAGVGSPLDFWDMQGRIEGHLKAAGIPYVLLKPVTYMSNLLASADSVRATAKLFLPAGEARVALIDPHDVAEVAAVVLTQDGHDGRGYELTGPEAVSYHDVAEQLSQVAGRSVEYVHVPEETWVAALRDAGVPAWFARNLGLLFTLIRQGAGAQVNDVVRVLTGREPRTLGEFLRDHASAFTS